MKSIDTSSAEKVPGVKAVHVTAPAGTEVQWQGFEIAAVAATTEEAAHDGIRAIKVDYEILPHLVREENLSKTGDRAKAAGEKVTGDPDAAFQQAEVVSEGTYGIPVITHCCLEPHGQVIQWQGDQVMAWPSTQDVTRWAPGLAPNIKVPATNIKVQMDYVGGGFGSKFAPDAWGEVGGAALTEGGRRAPVKLFLDRATEQLIAGNRPSAFGKIRLAGKKDGTLTGWHSETWATGGLTGGGSPPLPYVLADIPNQRAQPHGGFGECRPQSRVARTEQPAGFVPHVQRSGRLGGEGGAGPAGGVRQELLLRSQGARGDLPLSVAEGGRTGRLEETVAPAR